MLEGRQVTFVLALLGVACGQASPSGAPRQQRHVPVVKCGEINGHGQGAQSPFGIDLIPTPLESVTGPGRFRLGGKMRVIVPDVPDRIGIEPVRVRLTPKLPGAAVAMTTLASGRPRAGREFIFMPCQGSGASLGIVTLLSSHRQCILVQVFQAGRWQRLGVIPAQLAPTATRKDLHCV